MKVTINFDSEIEPAVQRHLDGGGSVQGYVRSALKFYNFMLDAEKNGSMCGYGDKSRFKSYNHEVSPSDFLRWGE